ncbi:Sjogren's syndrome/scleroderma autoantigen 1 family protein [Halorubrum sp. RMP-47]|uniref:Sjogren's syndrome/scleroderma autoantigen 1 family protein n=1 Tax=Halorubrum miltondacostae TaxID=3076378 RepID=A0ABD5M1A7_9EURY
MSDGFDKEAEREKLREKYADDEQKREHTQRMSELLLKGATMTNRHCEECGDPIFRHDGREFCPTCGNEAGGAAGGDAGAEAAGADETAGVATATAESGGDAPPENGVTGSDAADSGAVEGRQPQSPPSATVPPQGSSPQEPRSPPESPPQASGPTRDSAPQRSGRGAAESSQSNPSRSATDADGLGAARASLTRTLTRFARAAEETDDPRRARDHLEAAREAAEALAALD